MVQETENNSAYQTAEDETLGVDSTVDTIQGGDQSGDTSGISLLAGEDSSQLLQDSSQAEDSVVSREAADEGGGGGGGDEDVCLFGWKFVSGLLTCTI